jgi:RNA polymerase sigma-70 factor, ECF subfamily
MIGRDGLRMLGADLHAALLAGDVTAPARIAEAFMPPLVERTGVGFGSLGDPHLVATAVEDALISYFERPGQYDPTRLDLFGYLYMSARGDLLNMVSKSRREPAVLRLGDVELAPDSQEQTIDLPDDTNVEDEVLLRLSSVWQQLVALFPQPKDQEMVRLLIDRERDTEAYATVLGILEWPEDERAREVKRHKDRLKKRILRLIDPAEFAP